MADLTRSEEYLAAAGADTQAVQLMLPYIDRIPEAVCFHCEQAAEKMSKQMWVDKGFMPRQTYDLNDLLGIACEREWLRTTREEVVAIRILNAYATKFRDARMRESEKGEAYGAVECLNKLAAMLDRNGFSSVSVEIPAHFLCDEGDPDEGMTTAQARVQDSSSARSHRPI